MLPCLALLTVALLCTECDGLFSRLKDKAEEWMKGIYERVFGGTSADYMPDEWAVRFSAAQLGDFQTLQDDDKLRQLGHIAMYFRLVKQSYEDPYEKRTGAYYTHFSRSTMALHPELNFLCTSNFTRCVDYVWNLVHGTTLWFSRDFYVNRTERKIHEFIFSAYRQPFGSREDQHIFISTALYFLCWFTQLQLPLLRHIAFCEYTNLWNLDIISAKAPVLTLDHEPFRCSRLSFCPDQCCGQSELIDRTTACVGSKLARQVNPCMHLRNPVCSIPPEQNKDFLSLATNQFNISCDCGHPGLRFSVAFKMCIDIDECLERTNNCMKRDEYSRCVNTYGSFLCACAVGYHKQGGRCVLNSEIDLEKITVNDACRCEYGLWWKAIKLAVIFRLLFFEKIM